jgi:glutathione S-transferase
MTKKSTIKVHDLEHSRSLRIIWLLNELDVGYEHILYQRDPNSKLAPPELQSIHPLGKAPIVQDGDITLIESGAIIEYLIEHVGQGRLKPDINSSAYPAYLQWLHYAEGSVMPPLIFDLFTKVTDTQAPLLNDIVKSRIHLHLNYVNETLKEQRYFAGTEFTAADIMMEFVLNAASGQLIPGWEGESHIAQYEHIQSYLLLLHERPAYQQCLADQAALKQ